MCLLPSLDPGGFLVSAESDSRKEELRVVGIGACPCVPCPALWSMVNFSGAYIQFQMHCLKSRVHLELLPARADNRLVPRYKGNRQGQCCHCPAWTFPSLLSWAASSISSGPLEMWDGTREGHKALCHPVLGHAVRRAFIGLQVYWFSGVAT